VLSKASRNLDKPIYQPGHSDGEILARYDLANCYAQARPDETANDRIAAENLSWYPVDDLTFVKEVVQRYFYRLHAGRANSQEQAGLLARDAHRNADRLDNIAVPAKLRRNYSETYLSVIEGEIVPADFKPIVGAPVTETELG
jgi:hypothetical protein